MDDPHSRPPYPYSSELRPQPPAGESFLLSLVSAGLFLFVGFYLALTGVSGNPIYDGSVTAFTWGARIVGFGILATALMSLARLPGAALLDMVVSFVAAAGCMVVGVIWLAFSDKEGILVLLFGALNTSAARAAWLRWRALQTSRDFAPRPYAPDASESRVGSARAEPERGAEAVDDGSPSTTATLLKTRQKNRPPRS